MSHSPRSYRAMAALAAVGVLTLGACSPAISPTTAAGVDSPTTAVAASEGTSEEIKVTLHGRSATASGAGVEVKGSTVTIGRPGTYRLFGTLADGNVVVDSSDDGVVRLVLDGVDIRSSSTAPIAIMDADEAIVVLADGTKNTLTDTAGYVFADPATDEPNAPLFSATNLTISGAGALTVDGNDNDGIASKDGLVIAGGTIAVDAVDDGVRGKDYVVIDGGALTVTAGGDALKSDNAEDAAKGYVTVNAGTLDLTAGGDGVSAATNVVVKDGTLDVTAGGGSGRTVAAGASAKGLKGAAMVTIDSGTVSVDAADDALRVVSTDDGINAARTNTTVASGAPLLTISGGRIVIDSGGDGLDVNGTATMTAGTVIVNGPTARMNGAVDYDGTFTISGGLLVAAGSSGMVMAPSATSGQASLLKTFAAQPAGSLVHIRSTDGTSVLTFAPTKAYQSIVVSSPDVSRTTTYEVTLGGTASGSIVDGLYEAGAATGGTSAGTTTSAEAATRTMGPGVR